jgi:hypothetical protein
LSSPGRCRWSSNTFVFGVRDIVFTRTVQAVVQYLRLWDMLRGLHLSDQPDEFSSSSAYCALFMGRTHLAGTDHIWKIQALGRCRFFGWLVLHGHCWTSNRLRQHGLRDTDDYALCAQEVETLDHLLVGCVFARETWFRILRYFGLQDLTPQVELPFFGWWLGTRKRVHKLQRKGFDSLALLVAWSLWRKRNRQVHERCTL